MRHAHKLAGSCHACVCTPPVPRASSLGWNVTLWAGSSAAAPPLHTPSHPVTPRQTPSHPVTPRLASTRSGVALNSDPRSTLAPLLDLHNRLHQEMLHMSADSNGVQRSHLLLPAASAVGLGVWW